MKEITYNLLKILKKESKKSIKYFNKISLGDKTEIKFGFSSDSVSITFFIYGKPKYKNLCISKKLDRLFFDKKNLESLNKYLINMKSPTKFHYSPYLKINKEPEIFAGRIGFCTN
ncbi:MAG: hypothetical protein B6I24_01140 [Bacteroidetes bacterium 4572_128]|nr:MAG: hypothetical protein B6I24_01140 [Bacteroidetes bacterium 4572_128]